MSAHRTLLSTVTAIGAGGGNVIWDIDVQAVTQSLYGLPNTGLSPLSLKPSAVEMVMAAHLTTEKTIGTLFTVNFTPKAKPLIKVMKLALLGMLGSHHQVSGPQQKVLAALLSDDTQWNWEDVFLTNLLDISKQSKLRLEVKVSALILHATRVQKLSWSRTDPVYTSWIKLGTTKQQTSTTDAKKQSSKTQRRPSSSREETAGHSQTLLRDSAEPEQGSETVWRAIPEEEEVDSPSAAETAADATTPPAEQEPAFWRDIPDKGDELDTFPPSTSGKPSISFSFLATRC